MQLPVIGDFPYDVIIYILIIIILLQIVFYLLYRMARPARNTRTITWVEVKDGKEYTITYTSTSPGKDETKPD
jgi:hypothetical protein